MLNSKSSLLLAAALATGALFVSAPQARAQSSCVAASSPLHAYLDPAQGWLGQAWWVFGNAAPVFAAELTNEPTYEKNDGEVMIGTEKTTVDFGNGDTFQLITHWISHHVSNNKMVGEINEVGTIANGTGKFKDVTGIFYSAGTAGPGMSGDQRTFLWLGSRQGIVCGLPSDLAAAPAPKEPASQVQAGPVQFRR